jgi:hypothetical protein
MSFIVFSPVLFRVVPPPVGRQAGVSYTNRPPFARGVFPRLERFQPWKNRRLCYPAAVNDDAMIRKQVGRPRGERPLVRLDRLNRGLRNLGLMQPHESRTDHVRKIVGRAGHRAS